MTGNQFVLSVKQLNIYIKSVLESDRNLRSVTVKGEISNYVRHSRSGHMYFTLKDADSALKTVMFCTAADKVPVSYTHLDVYKRQGHHVLFFFGGGSGSFSANRGSRKARFFHSFFYDSIICRTIFYGCSDSFSGSLHKCLSGNGGWRRTERQYRTEKIRSIYQKQCHHCLDVHLLPFYLSLIHI